MRETVLSRGGGEARRARAAFTAFGGDGRAGESGEAEAVIEDETLVVGPLTVAFADADGLRSADYRIGLDLWPEGRLELSRLGRRFDTFSRELRHARSAARVVRLLAHGVGAPEVFDAAVVDGGAPRPTELQLYDTHVTLVPEDGDPWQIPLGAVTRVHVLDDPPTVVLETGPTHTVVGQLGRRRDAFALAVQDRLAAQARLLRTLTAQGGFADGLGVEADRIGCFSDLVERCTAPERSVCASELLAAATGPARLGFVRLLDPEGEALRAPQALPEHWASFLLVPSGDRTALEILAGPSAATYVFADHIEQVNCDLQALHFRRAVLALTPEQARVTPSNPHRLALRRLGPLLRLRTVTVARVLHDDRWSEGVGAALGQGST